METRSLFSGNALYRVDADGSLSLPGFVRRVVKRSGGGPRLLFGAHESDLCLTAYAPEHAERLEAELERQRIRDEARGAPAADHHRRARRAFGFVEEAELDGADRLVLPPLARRRADIDDLALFVGAGGSFEIWNPRLALEAGDETLRALAEYRLEQAANANIDQEEEDGR